MSSSSAPDSSSLFGLKFNELNESCLFDVFKYLPFNEKIRYQRVDRKWGDLLKFICDKQSVVDFKRNQDLCHFYETLPLETIVAFKATAVFDLVDLKRPYERTDNFCGKKGHFCSQSDAVVLPENASIEQTKTIWGGLRPICNQLKAIMWSTGREELLPLFVSNCNRLVHLEVTSRDTMIMIPFIESTGGSFERLKCLKLYLYDDQMSRVLVPKLMSRCPLLEALSVNMGEDDQQGKASALTALLVQIFTPALPRLVLLNICRSAAPVYMRKNFKLGSDLLETIATLGQNIETLSYSDRGEYGDEKYPKAEEGILLKRLVDKMPKLRRLSFNGFVENMKHLLSSRLLESIYWEQRVKDIGSQLIRKNIPTLKSLHLVKLPLNEHNWRQVLKIPHYYSNLENLKIIFSPNCLCNCWRFGRNEGALHPHPDDYTFVLPLNFFGGLKRLTRLRLESCHFRDEDVYSLLANCPKLRNITIPACRLLTPVILTYIAGYALIHPKREITINAPIFIKSDGEAEPLRLPSNLRFKGWFVIPKNAFTIKGIGEGGDGGFQPCGSKRLEPNILHTGIAVIPPDRVLRKANPELSKCD